MDGAELRQYAKTHLGMKDGAPVGNGNGGSQLSSVIEGTPSGSRFAALVRGIQLRDGVAPDVALLRAQGTEEGKRLWEQHRREQLDESATLTHFTQDRR
jgi:hypothetical protein